MKVPGNFRLDIPASNRDWATPNGKANFIVFRGLDGDPRYREAGVIKLATIRSHDHYNTTIYGFNDRYRDVRGRRDVVLMNEADMAEHGRSHRDLIDVEAIPLPGEAKAGRILRKLTAVAFDIAQGSAAAYYPEANPLVALGHLGIRSGTPAYKSVLVQSRVADLSDVASPRRADLTAVGPGGRPYVPSGLE